VSIRLSLKAAFALSSLSVHSATPDSSERKDVAEHSEEETRVIASGLGMSVLPLTDPASDAGSLLPLLDRILVFLRENDGTARPKFDALYPKRFDAADTAGGRCSRGCRHCCSRAARRDR
jgi:hypothetical protein